MKRSALLLLMGIVLLVVMGIAGSVAGIVVNLMLNKANTDPMLYYGISQIMSTLLGAITGAFLFAGSSALYFRYSSDEAEEQTSEHLLAD
jgi:nitrate reductase gamma subunit